MNGLRASAKRESLRMQADGVDYQEAWFNILNNPRYAPLFDGASESDMEDLMLELQASE